MSKLYQVYGIGQALIPSLPPPIPFENPPTSHQTNYAIGQVVYTPPPDPTDFYMYAGDGNWIQFIGGGGSGVTSVNGSNGVTASPTSGAVVVSGVNATTSTVGVASFNPADFTVSGGGEVSLFATSNVYTNVTFGMSPYTASATDYFISVDATGGAVTINLPANPGNGKQYAIMDRLGVASTNNITVNSLGGTTINNPAVGGPITTYVFTDGFESAEFFFHGTNYEVI